MRQHWQTLFGEQTAIIAMIHVGALPGTPADGADLPAVVERAVQEARLYHEAGVDALAIENMHDAPYLRGDAVGPEITAAMAVIGREVKRAVPLPCGVQILAGANRAALAVAHAAGLDFVRVEGFVFAHVADEGMIEACAGDLLRYRRQIGAERVLILSDIKKKHSSHALTADVDIAQTAHAAQLFRSDALVVTGAATGEPASADEIDAVRQAVSLPIAVGSGVTDDNVEHYLQRADGLIIGSHFKRDGLWSNPVEPARVERLIARVRRFRTAGQVP